MLIWPDPPELLAQTRDNHQVLSRADSVLIQGVSLAELRRFQRQWIGHEPDQLLVATGHQTELYHPGVWVKNLLINAAASALDGVAYHFAVDSDAPKHLLVRWLGGQEPITDDPSLSSAEWSGLVAPPTPQHLNHLERRFQQDASHWDFQPMLPRFLHSMRQLAMESGTLPAATTNALHELDWDLGLKHHALVTSPLWYSAPYLVLVHHMLARAMEFGGHYNTALDDYRQANRITSRTRPMPDLSLSAGDCEVPFWLDHLDGGTRERAHVRRAGDTARWRLIAANGEAFEFDPQAEGWAAAERLSRWLRQNQVRLAPRALTLTMFLRLLLVDQFVHGIGGGRYDQVLDRLIRGHFGIEPPRFSVTTGTLYFPGATQRTRACLPCVVQEGHKLRHGLLGEEKMKLVEEIESLPRRSMQRSQVFHQMHHRLTAATVDSPLLRQWQRRLEETEQHMREDEVIFDRELFYAIQPRARLEEMIGRYRGAMGMR